MFKGCVFFQLLSEEDVWFSSKAHRAVSARMAGLCSNGAMPCGQIDESTPVTWQLVRGAAVADPQVHVSPLCMPYIIHTAVLPSAINTILCESSCTEPTAPPAPPPLLFVVSVSSLPPPLPLITPPSTPIAEVNLTRAMGCFHSLSALRYQVVQR